LYFLCVVQHQWLFFYLMLLRISHQIYFQIDFSANQLKIKKI
jgi:hypothetical protein